MFLSIYVAVEMSKRASPARFDPARFIRAGPNWPTRVKRITLLNPARKLAGWRTGPRAFFHMLHFQSKIRFQQNYYNKNNPAVYNITDYKTNNPTIYINDILLSASHQDTVATSITSLN